MLAAAFGIPGQRISPGDQVEGALEALFNTEGPYLLQVSIDELENVWPLVPPGAGNENHVGGSIMMQHQLSIQARFAPKC